MVMHNAAGMTPIDSRRARVPLGRFWRHGATALPLVLGNSALYVTRGVEQWSGIWKIAAALDALAAFCWAVAVAVHTLRSMMLDLELKRGFDATSKSLLESPEIFPRTAKGGRLAAQTLANLERLQVLREKIGTRGS